jgi:hypothetical protein
VRRGDVHFATFLPAQDGTLPHKLRKRGTNTAIHMDVALMLKEMGAPMHMSAANVVLAPHVIDQRFIQRIVLLLEPRYTLYSRPTATQRKAAQFDTCRCIHCRKVHRLGTWWCVNGCWAPITYAGIKDSLGHLWQGNDHKAREHELQDVYGMNMKEFGDCLDKAGSSVNAIKHRYKIRADGTSGSTWRETAPTDSRKRERLAMETTSKAAPKAAPAAAALSTSRWTPKAAPPSQEGARPKAATLVSRAEAARPMGERLRPQCAHLTDSVMHKLNKAAKKDKHGDGGYLSHTDKYMRDAVYRMRCESLNPPHPEYFVFHKFVTIRVDGQEGDEFPH